MHSYTRAKRKADEKQAKKDRKSSGQFQSTVIEPVMQESDGVLSAEQQEALQAQAQANQLHSSLHSSGHASDHALRSPSLRNPYDGLGRQKQQAQLASNNYEQAI